MSSDSASYDYDAALELDSLVDQTALISEPDAFYRNCIEVAIPVLRPLWGRIITLGRRKFEQKLSRDESQCFRSAGLLEDPPTAAIISWWDRVAAAARQKSDQDKMLRARQAEAMSLQFELQRLQRLSLDVRPIWMAIEDNTAGYDIRSYDSGSDGPIARLIEVKSTIASPLRFRLTRNEWEAAKKYGAAYVFHIWDLRGPQLHERTAAEIAFHIPTDNERGRWENVEIPVIQSAPRP